MNSRHLSLLAVAVLLAAVPAASAEGDKFTTKYDNVDVDKILANERLFKKYLQCLLAEDDGHCTSDGKELRNAIPDALTNDCAKCSEKQKIGADKVIKYLQEKKPADWEKLQNKWDPEGIYMKRLVANQTENPDDTQP